MRRLTFVDNLIRSVMKGSKVSRWIYIALYYKPFISKALRYGPCVTRGSHSFSCHPHTNHACLYFPAARGHPSPFGWNSLRLTTKGWPGWVDLGGWSHTRVTYRHKCPAPGIEPGHGHPSQYWPGPTLGNFVDVCNAVTAKPSRHHALQTPVHGESGDSRAKFIWGEPLLMTVMVASQC